MKNSKHSNKESSESNKKDSSKKKSKIWLILGIILLVIIVGIAGFVYSILKTPSAPPAILSIEQGTVEYSRSGTWTKATDGMVLKQGDDVRTLQDSYAKIIIYETSILNMEPQTQLSLDTILKDEVEISQSSGFTWNKVMGVLGVKSYSVTTPNSVATVRGTAFGVEVTDENGEVKSNVLVGEGKVAVEDENGESVDVLENEQVTKKGKEKLIKEEATEYQKNKIKAYKENNLKELKKIRKDTIKNNKVIMSTLKSYNVDENNLDEVLAQVDRGEISIAEIKEKSPIKGGLIGRLEVLTNEIGKLEEGAQK